MTTLQRSAFVIMYMILIMIRIIWRDSTPYLIAILLISLIVGLILEFLAANRMTTPEIKTDIYKEFKSKYGQTLVAPSSWTSENTKLAWEITSADKNALIEVYWGEPPFDHEKTVTDTISAISRESSDHQRTPWTDIVIDGQAARKCSTETNKYSFVFYAIPSNVDPYLIVLRMNNLVVLANKDFYEKVVMTFKGRRVE